MRGYARSRRAAATCAGLMLAILATVVVHSVSLRLYFDPESSSVRLGLLTPVLAAIAVHQSLGDPLGEMEAVFARRLRQLRAVHTAVVLAVLASGLMGYAAVHGTGEAWRQTVRNTALLVGLLLAAVVLVGSDPAWVLPVGLVLATYGFGVDYDAGTPRGWALLFHEAAPADLAAALGVLLGAVVLFVLRGPRQIRAEDGGE